MEQINVSSLEEKMEKLQKRLENFIKYLKNTDKRSKKYINCEKLLAIDADQEYFFAKTLDDSMFSKDVLIIVTSKKELIKKTSKENSIFYEFLEFVKRWN